MRKTLITLLALSAATPVLAQHGDHDMHQMEDQPAAEPHADRDVNQPQKQNPQADPHAGHDMNQMPPQPADLHAGHDMGSQSEPESQPARPTPERAKSGPAHAADAVYGASEMAAAREQLRAESGGMSTYKFLADRLEYRAGDGKDGYIWDVQAWYGGDIDKLWLKSEGEGLFDEKPDGVEAQALWSHAIGPFFDLQAGVRYDFRPDPERAHLVLGVHGLAPYWFEIDAAAFVSDQGHFTARVEAEYDQRITQKLIMQPRIEANLSAQDVPELGIGAGLTTVEAGIRLRYQFAPEFAPYAGIEWERKIGGTADFAKLMEEDVNTSRLVVGFRAWF